MKGLTSLVDGLLPNETVVNLRLGENGLDTKSAQQLARLLKGNHTLTSVDLRENKLKDEGAAALAEALPHNHGLRCLVLWSNGIGGAGISSLAKGLGENKTIQILDIGDNRVDEAVRRHSSSPYTPLVLFLFLLPSLCRGHALTHSRPSLSSPLSPYTQVLDLKTALLTNSSVHTLGLANAHLGEAGGVTLAEVVEGNKSLQRLDLRRNILGIAGLMAINIALKSNSALLEIALDSAESESATARPEDAEMESHFMAEIRQATSKNAQALGESEAPAALGDGIASMTSAMERLSAYVPPPKPPSPEPEVAAPEASSSSVEGAVVSTPEPPVMAVMEPPEGVVSGGGEGSPSEKTAAKAAAAAKVAADAAKAEEDAAHAAIRKAAAAKEAAERAVKEAAEQEKAAKAASETAKRAEQEKSKKELEARVATEQERKEAEAAEAARAAEEMAKAERAAEDAKMAAEADAAARAIAAAKAAAEKAQAAAAAEVASWEAEAAKKAEAASSAAAADAEGDIDYGVHLKAHIEGALVEVLKKCPADPFKAIQQILFQASLDNADRRRPLRGRRRTRSQSSWSCTIWRTRSRRACSS